MKCSFWFKQQTIRELFDVYEGEKKEAESSVSPSDDEEAVNKQQTTILEQVKCILFAKHSFEFT